MNVKNLTRREFLRVASLTSIGLVASACAPTVAPAVAPTVAPPPLTSAPSVVPTAAGTAKSVVPSGTLTSAVSGFAEDLLDSVYGSPQNNSTLTAELFESLAADSGKELKPELAESWTVGSDGKVWTFKLRKGIKFHNGEEMTSADVKFSIERIITPKAKNAQSGTLRDAIASVDAPDPYTVLVTTKAVNSVFVDILASANVFPKKYIEEKGEDGFAKNPVGTGPWKFVKHEAGANVQYEAVKDHWRVTPAFQTLIVKQIPEQSTRMAMLKRGEVDLIDIALDASDEVKAGGFGIVSAFYDSQILMHVPGTWLNPGQPTNDIRFRQALSLAVNREELTKELFKGFAEPASRIRTAAYSFGWDTAWKADPYDPKKAKELLAAAGYPSKFNDPTLTVWSFQQAGFSWIPNMVLALSGYWEAVGIKTKVSPIDFAAMRAMYMARPVDQKIIGTVYPNTLTSDRNPIPSINAAWGSKGVAPVQNDPAWDALYTKVIGEMDETKRVDLFRQMMNRGADANVSIIIANVKQLYAMSTQIGEFREPFTSVARAFAGIQHKSGS